MTDLTSAHDEVFAVARSLDRQGLVEGSSGNVSARIDDGHVCMTPSSIPYDVMTVDDLVVVDMEGDVVVGEHSPTTEKALHLACYRRYPELGGVIHSHAVHATMFAVTRQPIPACIEEVSVYLGGDVEVCDYHVTGSDELGDAVAEMLAERAAVLLASHGMVTVGTTATKALHAAALVERTARIVWGARLMGDIVPLPDKVEADFASVYRMMRNLPSV